MRSVPKPVDWSENLSWGLGDPCAGTDTAAETDRCFTQVHTDSELALQKQYDALLVNLGSDQLIRSKIQDSYQKWLAWRESVCGRNGVVGVIYANDHLLSQQVAGCEVGLNRAETDSLEIIASSLVK